MFVAAAPAAAFAQDPPPTPAPEPSRAKQIVLFFTGAAAGLIGHETGHVLTGVIFDAHPRVKRIDYGPFPFFAISHDQVSRRREFVISSAGFWFQHAGSEWLLTARPHLADARAPFLKGYLAFNLGTSVVYAVAAMGKFGPPERDTRGMAVSLGKDGAPEPVIGMLVLAPALLDGYRYLRPEAAWAKWTSRGVKILGVVLTVAAGR